MGIRLMLREEYNNSTVGSSAMDLIKHLTSPIAPTFSEALRIDTPTGSWIFISGQVGVPLPPDKGSDLKIVRSGQMP